MPQFIHPNLTFPSHSKIPSEPMSHFAPANISLIFETYEAQPPHERGSLGVGITLKQGAQCRLVELDAEQEEPGIFVHGQKWAFPTVAQVVRELTEDALRIELKAAFPFGCGFGMSGASALATAYALNERNRLLGRAVLSKEELGMIAHRAEVANATGLGDVGGQVNGGIMIKTTKYAPLTVRTLPLRPAQLYVRVFGPLHTPDVIGSRERLVAVNAAGQRALEQISQAGPSMSLEQLFDISLSFAVQSELLKDRHVGSAIDKIRRKGGHASMVMLGQAVVSTIPFPECQTVDVLYAEDIP